MAETITQYRLETFLRGRLGTDAHVGAHSAADDVVVIDGTVQPVRLPLHDVGRTLKFKFVTSGQQIDHVPAIEHAFEGNSLRTLAPSGLRGTRDQPTGPITGSDLLIQWNRRSRIAPGMRPSTDVPVAEEQEVYDLEVYSGSTLKRTIRSIKPGLRLASVFIPERPRDFASSVGHATHNFVTAGGDGVASTITAVTAQRIPAPGNIYEGQKTVNLGAGFTLLGLDSASGSWVGLSEALSSLMPFGATLTGISTPYLALLENVGASPDRYRLSVYEYGTRIFSASNISGASDEDQFFGWFDAFGGATGTARVHIRFNIFGSVVLTQKGDPNSGKYTTLATSKVSTSSLFPLHGIAGAYGGTLFTASVEKTFITMGPSPATIYSVAQQEQDFGSAQSSVKVRVYQLSGVIGRGNYAEATI